VRIGTVINARLPEESPFCSRFYRVEFVVNANKRTVVTLIKSRRGDKVRARGIAKCAPDDCFNVHIGKVIALRRALGLEITEEYVKAPQPTEARVGDVVEVGNFSGPVYAIRPTKRTAGFADVGHSFNDAQHGLTLIIDYSGKPYEYWARINSVKVIDDSRETDVIRSEVAA